MAEVVGELGVKSPKHHKNIKSHTHSKPAKFANKNGKKNNEKQLPSKGGQPDSEISQTNISLQSSKFQREVKIKNITAAGGSSTNHSPQQTKQNQKENKKDHMKSNKEFANGFEKHSNNARSEEKSQEQEKKVKSKKGQNDSSSKKEKEDIPVVDVEQSFQGLKVGGIKQEHVNERNVVESEKEVKVEQSSSKKSPKSKDRIKDIENMLLQQARNKFWLNYFQKHPTELLTLAFHKMNELQKVDAKQHQAQFKCGVCQYYCNSMSVVTKHIREDRHNRNIKKQLDNNTVKKLPNLPASHTDVQTEMLENLYKQYGMTENDRRTRKAIVDYIDDLVQKELPGCSVRMFGSSVHCLGLKSSDLNIDLRVGENWVASKALCLVAELIKKTPAFRRVKTNFTEKIPTVVFLHSESKVTCVISLNNERPVLLAALIAKYAPLHPVLPRLTTVFRLWGKLARVDQQDKGLWPAYALYLLVIFFLQHCYKPVLPVLNDFVTVSVSDNPSQNDSNDSVLKLDIDEVKSKWQSKNTQTLGELWLNLLQFYASNCDSPDYVVSIDNSEAKFRQPKRINIVDPFMPKRNVTRTVTCSSLYSYIAHCLKTTYKYFGVPQTRQGPIFGNIADELAPPEKYLHHKDVFAAHNFSTSQFIRAISLIDKNYVLNGIPEDEAYRRVAHVLSMKDPRYLNLNNVNIKLIERSYPNDGQYKTLIVSPQDANYLIHQLDPAALEYKFNRSSFTSDMKIPLVCEVCKEEGHTKDECPSEELSPLEKLPPVDEKMISCLDAVCQEVFEKWIPDSREIRKRDEIVCLLQKFISFIYPTAVLTLFGSSKNGFGSKRSDLDICLTFTEEDARKGLKAPAFIEKLGVQLKKCPGLKNVLTISSAKVPIIKFEHTESRLEGDISLYNILGQENTHLLRSYTEIDNRVSPLGYMMKKFAKHCHIGDASKGGLSSYAYSLMVIYFLQHCSPPVLPVLQELHEGDGPCPEVFIDDCNTYYYKDIHKLNEVWKDRQTNTNSVGHLWLQLLRFYTETFDIENHVISIRTSKTVTKFEKLWISKCFAIEDPFDVAHNLGSALSRNMNAFIIKRLRQGRKIFGTPPLYYSQNHNSNQPLYSALYFNSAEFQATTPPNDRGCRYCKTIGHIVRDCPTKQAVAERKSAQKKHKDSENIGAISEESRISLSVSDSDSEYEKDSPESLEDKMVLSKQLKTPEGNDSPQRNAPYSKLKSLNILYSQPPADSLSQAVAARPKPKSMKGSIKKTNSQQEYVVGIPLVRTQNLSGSSFNNSIQEKYWEEMTRIYNVPYHMLQSKEMRTLSPTTRNLDSGEFLSVQTKRAGENEGSSEENLKIPQTLVYTNSNLKSDAQKFSVTPQNTCPTQIPTSMTYTNSNYRNTKNPPGLLSSAERSQSHEVIRSVPEIHQHQHRLTVMRTPATLGNHSSGSSANEVHSHQYENVDMMSPLLQSPQLPQTVASSYIPPSYLRSVDPRLGHPLVSVTHMPNHSVPQMGSMASMNNNNFHPSFAAYDNRYPYFNSIQMPGGRSVQISSAMAGRNVHSANGPHNATRYEDNHAVASGFQNSGSNSVGDSSSNAEVEGCVSGRFSYFTAPTSATRQMTSNYNNKNRNKIEFNSTELKQLDKRAKLLTQTRDCRLDKPSFSNMAADSKFYRNRSPSQNSCVFADMKKVQKGNKCFKDEGNTEDNNERNCSND